MIKLTASVTADLLRLAVAERGADHLYTRHGDLHGSCTYFWNGQADCIVGHVLHYLGLTPLSNHESKNTCTAHGLLWTLLEEGELEYDDVSKVLLAHVQERQDFGQPWGASVKYALAMVGMDTDLHTSASAIELRELATV